MKWISVNAKPKEYTYVLIWGHDFDYKNRVMIGRYMPGQDIWMVYDIDRYIGVEGEVTHWMPLPPNPNELNILKRISWENGINIPEMSSEESDRYLKENSPEMFIELDFRDKEDNK